MTSRYSQRLCEKRSETSRTDGVKFHTLGNVCFHENTAVVRQMLLIVVDEQSKQQRCQRGVAMSMVRRDVIRTSADRTFAALDLAPAVALVLALALGRTRASYWPFLAHPPNPSGNARHRHRLDRPGGGRGRSPSSSPSTAGAGTTATRMRRQTSGTATRRREGGGSGRSSRRSWRAAAAAGPRWPSRDRCWVGRSRRRGFG